MRLKTALLTCAMTMTMAGAAQARQITSIRLETTITNPTEGWIQIQEITAEANGVNVAAASNGGSAQATSIYSAGYEADKIIDGIEQQGNFYHSGTPQGDIVTLSFARRSDVTRRRHRRRGQPVRRGDASCVQRAGRRRLGLPVRMGADRLRRVGDLRFRIPVAQHHLGMPPLGRHDGVRCPLRIEPGANAGEPRMQFARHAAHRRTAGGRTGHLPQGDRHSPEIGKNRREAA